MSGSRWAKIIVLLIMFILIFLIVYEIMNKDNNYKMLGNNSTINDIYYCDSDIYTLSGNTCIKYTITNAIMLGDVDSSGIVDIADIDLIKQYIDSKKEFTQIQIKAGDVNNDSQVDIDDVSLLQDYIVKPSGDIGSKLICDDDYELEEKICKKKIIEEALKLNYKLGDINLNGKLDEDDLDLLNKYLDENLSLTDLQLKVSDINKDGSVNKEDYNILKKKKLSKEKIENTDFKQNSIHFDDFDLNVRYDKSSLKLNGNTTVNYYINISANNSYYYIFKFLSSSEVKETSMCSNFKNGEEKLFKINIIGKNNYGVLKIYDDSNCSHLIDSYETEKFTMKHS